MLCTVRFLDESGQKTALMVVVLAALAIPACSKSENPRAFEIAAAQGDLESIESYLASDHIDIDQYDAGVTALQNAAMRGHLEIVAVLYSAGASPAMLSEHGDSTLGLVAAGTGSVDVGEWLMQHGDDPCVPMSEWLSELRIVDDYVELARALGNLDYAAFLQEVTSAC